MKNRNATDSHKPAKLGLNASAKPKGRFVAEKSAGAIVYRRIENIDYLLILSNYWEFPKGLVEGGEDEVAAAIREVREETGLKVDLLPGFREEINYLYRKEGRLIKKQVVYFLGEATNQNVMVSWEHKEAKWLRYPEALALLKYENARSLLARANHHLTRNLKHANSSH